MTTPTNDPQNPSVRVQDEPVRTTGTSGTDVRDRATITERHETSRTPNLDRPMSQPGPDSVSREVNVRTGRGDHITWGPVWAGTVVAFATFLLLEMAFLSLGWLTLGDDTSTSTLLMSGLAGLVALLLGGLTAGASSRHRGVQAGLLHGLTVWGLVVSSMTVLTILGGGALFGPFTRALALISSITSAASQGADVTTQLDAFQSTAANGLLTLAVLLGAAVLGALIGIKMWPRKDDDDRTIDLS